MKVKVFVCGLCFVLSSFVEAAEPLITDGEISVTREDIDVIFAEVNLQAQVKTLRNDSRMQEIILQAYLQKKMAKEALDMGLADSPLVKAQLARVRDRLLLQLRLAALDSEQTPDLGTAVKEYYQAHLDDYKTVERARVKHILVLFDKHEKEGEAMAVILAAKKRLLAGEEFDIVAADTSEAPKYHVNKGDLGFFRRTQMQKAFSDAAFSLKNKGDRSDVVESSYGYHIMELIDREDARVKPFDEVKGQIEQIFTNKYIRSRRQDKFDQLTQTPGLKIDTDNISDYLNAIKSQAEKKWAEVRKLNGINDENTIGEKTDK